MTGPDLYFRRFIKSSLLSGRGSVAVTFTAGWCQPVTWWRVWALKPFSAEKLGGGVEGGATEEAQCQVLLTGRPWICKLLRNPSRKKKKKRKTTCLMWLHLKISRFKQQTWHLQHISPSYCLFSFISAAQVRGEFLGFFINKYLIIFPLHCHSIMKRGKAKGWKQIIIEYFCDIYAFF